MAWNYQIPARAEDFAERNGAGSEPRQSTVLSYILRMIAKCLHEDSQEMRASFFFIQGMWAHAQLQLWKGGSFLRYSHNNQYYYQIILSQQLWAQSNLSVVFKLQYLEFSWFVLIGIQKNPYLEILLLEAFTICLLTGRRKRWLQRDNRKLGHTEDNTEAIRGEAVSLKEGYKGNKFQSVRRRNVEGWEAEAMPKKK